jgi:hypothetical protein
VRSGRVSSSDLFSARNAISFEAFSLSPPCVASLSRFVTDGSMKKTTGEGFLFDSPAASF